MQTILSIKQLSAGYGSAQVLFGVDLDVAASEVFALLGRNGMGKSTLIRSILGLTAVSAGKVAVAGKDVTGWPSHRVARAGVGWVPEGRQIFTALTIEENLLVSTRRGSWTLEKVYQLFPRLQERKHHFGNQISGGEQQMLAIGRALLTQPAILMLDEATEGLAPLVRLEIWRTLEALKASGQSVLIVDRDLDALGKLADRFAVMEKGRVAFSGTSIQLKTDRAQIERLMGVS
jgi:branched-chain amino acid transport system ATP-binding protein